MRKHWQCARSRTRPVSAVQQMHALGTSGRHNQRGANVKACGTTAAGLQRVTDAWLRSFYGTPGFTEASPLAFNVTGLVNGTVKSGARVTFIADLTAGPKARAHNILGRREMR